MCCEVQQRGVQQINQLLLLLLFPIPSSAALPSPPPPPQTQLGWAWTDRHTFAAFQAEAAAAPAALQPALK